MSDDEAASASEFGTTLAEHFDHLTKSEKRIANYLRRNQDEAAFLAAGELADRLGLSEATVVRFARTLGFESYPAMRAVLQENFRRRVTHSVRLRGRLDELREAGDIFEKVTVSEIDYLTEALQTVDREALHQTVAVSDGAGEGLCVWTGPIGVTGPSAQPAPHPLWQAGHPADRDRARNPGTLAPDDRPRRVVCDRLLRCESRPCRSSWTMRPRRAAR